MNPIVLYEDEYVLALDKPSGLLVHGDGKSKDKTLTDWLNENYPEMSEVGEDQVLQTGEKIKRPGIVHRLDKETSGVIIVCKNKEAFQFLKEQFQNRKVEKIYHAVVWGNFPEDPSTLLRTGKMQEDVWHRIDKPIGRSASDFRKWSAEFGAKGELREAVTEYKVLAQGDITPNPSYIKRGVEQKTNPFSYLEVRPKTGRTHQIRVHMKAVGHPVVCDKLYGSGKVCDGSLSCLSFSRLALHALSIKIELPNHTFVNIESQLPRDFEGVRDRIN